VCPTSNRKRPEPSGQCQALISSVVDAWEFDSLSQYVVSDSFTLTSGSNLNGFGFWVWLVPGETITSAFFSITDRNRSIRQGKVSVIAVATRASAGQVNERSQPLDQIVIAPRVNYFVSERPARIVPIRVHLSSESRVATSLGKTVCFGTGMGMLPLAARHRMAFSTLLSAASAWERSSFADSFAPGAFGGFA